MDFSLMLQCVGLQADTEPVQALLRDVGWTKPIKFKRGDSDAYVSAKTLGVSLLFEESSYFEAQNDCQLPTQAPVLTAVFLYGPGHDEFSTYQGGLPQGVGFADSKAALTKRLGPSALYDANFGTEAWDLDARCRLFVDYAPDQSHVLVMQVGLRPRS